MKRQWRLRREVKPGEDGQRRWDQAYQHLLRWATKMEPEQNPCSTQTQEVYAENRGASRVRVSTQRQAQTQTNEQQLERLRAHIQSQGWELPEESIFRDDGYSGATLNRPGLDRLRDKVKACEIDRVLLTAPDRLARKYAHQVVVLEELEQLGCQVEFLDRPTRTCGSGRCEPRCAARMTNCCCRFAAPSPNTSGR